MENEKIEKAIDDITGLLIDFGDAVDVMRNVRELLYSLIEKEQGNENKE